MTIYIHKYNASLVAILEDGGEPVDICVDQGFVSVNTILVGSVQKKIHGQYLIDMGAKTPAILFDKSQSLNEGQKVAVQIKRAPQKEAFDIKPYEVTDLLQTSDDSIAVTLTKKGVHLSSEIQDKTWRQGTQNDLESDATDASIHVLGNAYPKSVSDLKQIIASLKGKAKDIYATDLTSCKVGDRLWGGSPEWLRFCERHNIDVISSDSDVVAMAKANGLNATFDLKPDWLGRFESLISDTLEPLVQIPGGGIMIIEEGHAVTSIDINTSAGSLGSSYTPASISSDHDLLEFAKIALNESIRQLYLRNIGGIVLIDLPRLQNRKHQTALEKLVKSYDGRGLQVLGPTKSGLFEFTKKKDGMSVKQALMHKE